MKQRTVGSLVLDTVRSNVIRIDWNGEMTADDVNAIAEYTSALQLELGDDQPIYALIMLGEGVQIKRTARKGVTAFGREKPWVATAIVGARYEVKVLLELTINAVRLLVKDPSETNFMDTEAEALAWLDELAATS